MVQFQILGVWDHPFTLKKFYAPVLSGPWRRPCYYILEKVNSTLNKSILFWGSTSSFFSNGIKLFKHVVKFLRQIYNYCIASEKGSPQKSVLHSQAVCLALNLYQLILRLEIYFWWICYPLLLLQLQINHFKRELWIFKYIEKADTLRYLIQGWTLTNEHCGIF